MRNQYKALSEKYVSEAVILPQEGYDYFDEILEAIIEVSLTTGNEPLNEMVTRAINARLFEYNIKFNVLEFPGGGALAIAPPGNVIWIAPKISQHIYNLIKKSQKISSDSKQIRLMLLKDPVVQLTKHTFAHELIHKVQTNKAKMFVPYSNKVVKKHGMRPITSYTSDEINKIPNFRHWYYDTLYKKVYPNEPKEIMAHAYELAQA